MDILKIAGLAVLAIIMTEILKSLKSELALFPCLLLTVYILFESVSAFSELYRELTGLLPSGVDSQGLACLLKVTGICLMTDFISDFSLDLQSKSLSNAVNLFGRISMIVCVLPLIKEIIEFV